MGSQVYPNVYYTSNFSCILNDGNNVDNTSSDHKMFGVPAHSARSHFFFRCGIALALNKLSQYLDESQVTPLFLFFVPDALNDRHAEVRRCMLDAALSALNTHGKVLYSFFFSPQPSAV